MVSSEVSRLKKAIALDPFDHDARLVLADALEETNRPQEAGFERLLVGFLRLCGEVVGGRPFARQFGQTVVGVESLRVNLRVFTQERRTDKVETRSSALLLGAPLRRRNGAAW